MKQELQDLLSECTDELNDIESRINDLPALDKARCYLTNYALIRACGTVEFVYRSIVADHFSQLGNPRLDTYLDSTIRQGSNSAKYDTLSPQKHILHCFHTSSGIECPIFSRNSNQLS